MKETFVSSVIFTLTSKYKFQNSKLRSQWVKAQSTTMPSHVAMVFSKWLEQISRIRLEKESLRKFPPT